MNREFKFEVQQKIDWSGWEDAVAFNSQTSKSKLPEMTYTHLTQDERCQIYILKKAGHDQSDIANMLGRNKSTISRELKRNCGARGYRPKQAQELSLARQSKDNGATIADETWAFSEAKLAEHWSPEQISGYLKVNNQPAVNHESTFFSRIKMKRLFQETTLHAIALCGTQSA